MNKPTNIEQWAWDKVLNTIDEIMVYGVPELARALMAVAASVSIKEIVRLIRKGGE